MTLSLRRRAAIEALGTALLVAAIVGSGIMAERLAGKNVAIALLANTLATAGALVALISAFGPFSGAHFNPAVTFADACQRGLPWSAVPAYVIAQAVGAILGATVANVMFDLPFIQFSSHARSGPAMLLSEFIATFGLVIVMACCARGRPAAVPYAVAAYITAGYWFTPSTSFANPAVTLARALTESFSGIRPVDAAGFMAVQFGGAGIAVMFARWLSSDPPVVTNGNAQVSNRA